MKDTNGTEHESYQTMGLAPTGAKHVDSYGNIYYGGSTSVGNVYDDQQKAFWAGFSSSSGNSVWTGSAGISPDYSGASSGVTASPAISYAAPRQRRRKRTPQPLTRTKIIAITALATFGIGIWCWLGPQISDGGAVLAACEFAAFMMLAFVVIAVPNTLPSKGRFLWRSAVCLQWLLPPVAGLCFSASVTGKTQPILAQLFPILLTWLIAAMPVFLLVSFPLALAMYRCDPLRQPKA